MRRPIINVTMLDSNYNNGNSSHPFDDHLLNNFPSHLLGDDTIFLDTILPYQLPPPPATAVDETTNIHHIEDNSGVKRGMKKTQGGERSKRKTGKKDRHSKIYTAHGPRDRRMRLSLQIARKFFDLQDMLGFDKASKTIEWLFNKSRAAIKDLTEKSCTTMNIPSSGSPLEEIVIINGNKKEKLSLNKKKESKGGGMLEVNEKRKEARARARERTKEKLMKHKQPLAIKENPNNYTLAISKSRIDEAQRSWRPLEDQMASVGIIEKFLAASSSMASNFSQENGVLNRAFSMEMGQFGVIPTTIEGTILVNSEYNTHIQASNFAFMDRRFDLGY